jgi:hypothetical protein
MEKKDFTVGQKVYLKIIEGSNAARYIDKSNPDAWIKEKVVTKVGNKYLSVANIDNNMCGEEKFDIQNGFRHYYTAGGQDFELFLFKEDIYNYIECEKLYDDIKSCFASWKNNGKYSLEQLRSMLQIINN